MLIVDVVVQKWGCQTPKRDGDTKKYEKNPQKLLSYHKVMVQEITNSLKIWKEPVGFILRKYLSMRKLFLKLVPPLPTVDIKPKLVNNLESWLGRVRTDFLRRYVTLIQYYILDSNGTWTQWTEAFESLSKLARFWCPLFGIPCNFVRRPPWRRPDIQ